MIHLAEIIRKAAAGEALQEEERTFLGSLRPDDLDPVSLRSARETNRALEERNRELTRTLEQSRARVEELETRSLPEAEQLRRKFETELAELRRRAEETGAERDAAQKELRGLRFRRRVDELADRYRFTDRDYLEYLCERGALEVDSPEQSEAFMEELRTRLPRFFKTELKPGAGLPDTPPVAAAGGAIVSDPAAELARMIAAAPESLQH